MPQRFQHFFSPFQKIVMEFVTEFRHKIILWWKSVTIFRCNSLLWRKIVTDFRQVCDGRWQFRHKLWRRPSQLSLSVTVSPTVMIPSLQNCDRRFRHNVHHNYQFSVTMDCDGKSSVTIILSQIIVTDEIPSQSVRHNLNCDQWNCDRLFCVTLWIFLSQF